MMITFTVSSCKNVYVFHIILAPTTCLYRFERYRLFASLDTVIYNICLARRIVVDDGMP